MKPVSKSKYMAGRQCHRRLWLTIHERDAPELVPDTELQGRFAHGHQVGALACERFPNGVVIRPLEVGLATAVAETEEAIASGAPAVFEATFVAAGARCAVDVLERREDGRWSVIEVKATTKAKPQHVHDLAFQTWLVSESAGLDLATAEVMHLSPDYRAPSQGALMSRTDVTADVLREVAAVPIELDAMKRIIDGPEPDVRPGPQCRKPYECPFVTRCGASRPRGHVSELYRIRTDRVARLESRGISTIAEMPQGEKLSAVQERQRRVAVTGERWVSPSLGDALEVVSGVVAHLDFETVSLPVPVWGGTRPWQQVPVQVSVHLEFEGEVEHREYLAEPGTDPRRGVAEFVVSMLEGVDTVTVWYEAFERGRIREMAEAFPDLAERLYAIDAKVADLLPIVRDHVYDEGFRGSFSIKKVFPVLCPGEGWEDLEVGGGGLASVLLERYLVRPEDVDDVGELRRQLLAYCERDTWAMVLLLRRLREM